MEKESQNLTADEAAAILGVTPLYVRILTKNETIPSVQIGKSRFIEKSVLENKDLVFKFSSDVPDQIRKKNDKPRFVALSFFSGAMGLDLGLEKAGIEFSLASEMDPIARKTILLNRPDIGLIGDINNYNASDIRRFAGLSEDDEIDLMIGGPPCQAFSTAGKMLGFGDKRGNVFLTFIDRILSLRPRLAVIENVRGLLSATYVNGEDDEEGKIKGSALSFILETLRNGGYTVKFNLYNAANYGAPQKRERVVMFCSRDGIEVPYLYPTNSEDPSWNLPGWRSLYDAIGDLEESECECLSFPEKRLKYYRLLQPGQYWKDLPADLQEEAMGAKLKLGGGKTGFLRRLSWDDPSPTLVTDPTMPATDLCHPTLNRPLSVQEYKRIQEFPDSWRLFGATKDKYRQIGNAVPVSLGYAIGKQVVGILEGKEIKRAPKDFPFSRYKNTDDVSFSEYYAKQLRTIRAKKKT